MRQNSNLNLFWLITTIGVESVAEVVETLSLRLSILSILRCVGFLQELKFFETY
jgi:hypothetical protein